MGKIKVGALGMLDEHKFRRLSSLREDWINDGDDMLINPEYKLNKIANELKPNSLIVQVKKVLKENEKYKTIVLNSCNGEELPIFEAGQKISITLSIKDKFYSRPYTITCSPSRALYGEYRITLKDSDDIVDKYLFNDIKLDEKITISSPFGEFYYNKIRDMKNVIAIINDKGIMPIYAMVQAIIDGTLNFNLNIFYSEKKEENLLFKEELMNYDSSSTKINVNFVLSEEEKEGFMTGFVSYDKMKPILNEDTSIFISGNEGMYKYLDKEIEKFKLPKKFVRYDSFFPKCNIRRVVKYNLSIYINNEKYVIPCYNNKTIMKAIEEGGIYIPSRCQNGSCGFCRSELVLGDVKVINDKRTSADKKFNFIHPCSTYPLSDIEIIVR